PDVIVLITNDAWFGTFQGPSQHLAQARARAIELGVPVIRVANRGVSAVINARGDFDTAIGVEATGYVDAPIPLPLSATIYARFRDIPALLFAFLLLIGALRRPSRIRS
ncbi:MAG: nitrilase-related carbon-nitrogen hydrolase, partial [Planktomarina sp.]